MTTVAEFVATFFFLAFLITSVSAMRPPDDVICGHESDPDACMRDLEARDDAKSEACLKRCGFMPAGKNYAGDYYKWVWAEENEEELDNWRESRKKYGSSDGFLRAPRDPDDDHLCYVNCKYDWFTGDWKAYTGWSRYTPDCCPGCLC